MEKQELRKLIAIWFEEDIRDGDHTSLSCIPPTQLGCQQLIIKDTGVLPVSRWQKKSSTISAPNAVLSNSSMMAIM